MKNAKQIVWIISFLFMALAASSAKAVQVPAPLVETGWLSDNIGNVVVLDVRNGSPELAAFTASGHIPGAVLVNWSTVRVTRVINGVTLTRMVPTRDQFNALMRANGVNNDSAVVITSKGSVADDITESTRLYWTFKYFGYDNVAVLNGGTAKWTREARTVSTAPSAPATGNFTALIERSDIDATTDDVLAAMENDVNKNKYKHGKDVQLVDARDLTYYLGMVAKPYVYAKGHIPGTRNFPGVMLFDPDLGTFLAKELVMEALQTMGIDPNGPVIAICNSGHEATGLWFVLHELAGNQNVKLYDGSMHEWTMDPTRPVVYMKWEDD